MSKILIPINRYTDHQVMEVIEDFGLVGCSDYQSECMLSFKTSWFDKMDHVEEFITAIRKLGVDAKFHSDEKPAFKLTYKYKPVVIHYINSKGNEIILYGAQENGRTILVGDQTYQQGVGSMADQLLKTTGEACRKIGLLISITELKQ